MSFAPYAVLWVALVAASGVNLWASRRLRISLAATFAAFLLAFNLWFFFRLAEAAPALSLAGRSWVVGAAAWQLTGVALLLALTTVVYSFIHDDSRRTSLMPAAIMGLTAAALPAVWAADDQTRILGITLFAIGWAIVSRIVRSGTEESGRGNWRFAFLLFAGVFPLWLGTALPDGRALLGVVAAAVLIGVWPFSGWRGGAGTGPATSLLLGGLPVVVGAAALASITDGGITDGAAVALATALGLLGMVFSLVRAWGRSRSGLATALGAGLAGLVLVAAAWAGEAAMVFAVRLAVFVPAILLLSAPQESTPHGDREAASIPRATPALLGLAVAFVAVAGLPLTTGFAALSPLYETWRSAGGWVLLIVLVVIISLWLAAIALFGRNRPSGPDGGRKWRHVAALLLPIIGLIHFDLAQYDVGLLTWVALVIPPVTGALIARFVPNLEALDGLVSESVDVPASAAPLMTRFRQASRIVADAIADALAILEGENGLLWLLGLLLLLVWMA